MEAEHSPIFSAGKKLNPFCLITLLNTESCKCANGQEDTCECNPLSPFLGNSVREFSPHLKENYSCMLTCIICTTQWKNALWYSWELGCPASRSTGAASINISAPLKTLEVETFPACVDGCSCPFFAIGSTKTGHRAGGIMEYLHTAAGKGFFSCFFSP